MAKCDFNKEIKIWHGCSPVNLLHIFRTPFYKNTSGGLLLYLGPCQISAMNFFCSSSLTISVKRFHSEAATTGVL